VGWGGWRRVKGWIEVQTPRSASTRKWNSEFKFKTPSPLEHSTARVASKEIKL